MKLKTKYKGGKLLTCDLKEETAKPKCQDASEPLYEFC